MNVCLFRLSMTFDSFQPHSPFLTLRSSDFISVVRSRHRSGLGFATRPYVLQPRCILTEVRVDVGGPHTPIRSHESDRMELSPNVAYGFRRRFVAILVSAGVQAMVDLHHRLVSNTRAAPRRMRALLVETVPSCSLLAGRTPRSQVS